MWTVTMEGKRKLSFTSYTALQIYLSRMVENGLTRYKVKWSRT